MFFSVFIFPLTNWGQLSITTYSVGDGLAQSQVYAMLEDSRGYIWMGTRGGGISRFDGQKFKSFTTHEGLTNNKIWAIHESENGNIWIGTDDGISIYNGISFEKKKLQNDNDVAVVCFLKDKSGVFWLGTSVGIYQYEDGKFINWSEKTGRFNYYITDLYEHIDGTVWACSDRGLLKIEKNTYTTYGKLDGLANTRTRYIVGDKTGIYISTNGGGLFKYFDNQFSLVTDQILVINDMYLDEGTIWLSTTGNGIAILDLGTKNLTRSITKEHGLGTNNTLSILKDNWNNYWFATTGGAYKYSGQEFEHITTDDWLKDKHVYDVHVSSKGSIWSSYSTGLTMKKEDTIIHYNSSNGYYGGRARVITEDNLGNIWIGTDRNGVFCFNGTAFHNFTRADGIPSVKITDILEDSLYNIWISTANGIAKLTPREPNKFLYDTEVWRGELNVGSDAYITDLEADKRGGRIWFSSSRNGIGYFFEENIQHLGTESGIPDATIRCLKISPKDNHLWIGTEEKGVSIGSIDGLISFDRLDVKSGLTSDNIYLIEFDEQGNVWIGTEKGVDKIKLNDDNEVAEFKHFGKNNGFTGVETNKNASCKDANGNLYFGTIEGLMKYNPLRESFNSLAPKLSINRISLFYKELSTYPEFADLISDWYSLTGDLVLKYNQNHISFNFAGIDQKNPEAVNYRFQLEGFDEEWSPKSAKNDATYSNLPPGNYKFKVKAVNEDNVWTQKPISFSFSISPPFWQTLWFLIGSIGIGILTLSLLITLRIRAIKKKVRLEKETIEMERSMLELEQKALRLQMNPHFIFNSLNSVQALILRKDQKSARYYLAKFSKLMRQTLENSRSQLISVRDEISALENYLELENFGREEPIEFIINIGENIDPDNVLIPAILLQPFAENAIIHGFKELERKPKLHVEFLLQDEILTCSISDNGNGREHAKKSKAQIEQQHKSAALEVTQERLSLLNQNEVKKGFEIIDLYDDGIAMGTKVVLRMKLNELF